MTLASRGRGGGGELGVLLQDARGRMKRCGLGWWGPQAACYKTYIPWMWELAICYTFKLLYIAQPPQLALNMQLYRRLGIHYLEMGYGDLK